MYGVQEVNVNKDAAHQLVRMQKGILLMKQDFLMDLWEKAT